MSDSSVFVRSSNFIVVILLLNLFTFFSVVFSNELVFVVDETGSLQVTPRTEVIDSLGITSICERLHIHGLQRRLKHIDKYAHSLKLTLLSNNASNSIDICFHRNSSRAIGMCPHGQWKKVSKGLPWVGIMSPFDYKILEIRIFGGSSNVITLELSAKQEFFMYRIVFLIMGIVLLSLASRLSKSVVFYYVGAMSIGIIILVTLIINQGIKRLPTGGKSRLELFLYSSMIGVGGYFLQCIRGLIQDLLMQIGINEDLYIPLAIVLVVFVFIFGAWSGFWTVKKFVVTNDGSIDTGTTIFVSWSIRAFAVVLILQSSLDPLLGGGALVSVILISSILKSISRKLLAQRIYEQDDETESWSLGLTHATSFASPLPRGSNKMSRTIPLSDSDIFPSSFHKTPEGRRKLTNEELEKFTKESTEKALKELVSSPGFGEWAVKNATRISVNPIKESSSKFGDTVKRRRWFL
ncbi:NEMP family [Arabidopsis suecica]|uniref:NEMP family n=1 Tax=Arabidopsis suecica TaxID=45249 RepID=A0A8T1ZW31_ARASU|nr:NEMP family [Arabidopsis suecica]